MNRWLVLVLVFPLVLAHQRRSSFQDGHYGTKTSIFEDEWAVEISGGPSVARHITQSMGYEIIGEVTLSFLESLSSSHHHRQCNTWGFLVIHLELLEDCWRIAGGSPSAGPFSAAHLIVFLPSPTGSRFQRHLPSEKIKVMASWKEYRSLPGSRYPRKFHFNWFDSLILPFVTPSLKWMESMQDNLNNSFISVFCEKSRSSNLKIDQTRQMWAQETRPNLLKIAANLIDCLPHRRAADELNIGRRQSTKQNKNQEPEKKRNSKRKWKTNWKNWSHLHWS